MGLKIKEEIGLSNVQALKKLQSDIQGVLNQFRQSQKTRKSKSWIRDTFHHCSPYTCINWISTVLLTIVVVSLIASYKVQNDIMLLFQGLFVMLLLILSLVIQWSDNKWRHQEIPLRIKTVIEKIDQIVDRVNWNPENFPHLLCPFSPCITLQWTYRNNRLVNLPWALLVKGDIILIRPGQISPGYCESIDKNPEYPLLHAKEVYGPSLPSANEFFSAPKSRKPLNSLKYRLLETPYLNNLRIALDQALDRPTTQHNQERHFIMIRIIERILLPISLVLIFITEFIKYVYVDSFVGSGTWLDVFVLVPASVVLPLLPLIFPVGWHCLNYLGMAKYKALFDKTNSQMHIKLDYFEDADSSLLEKPKLSNHWKEIWRNFINILKGKENYMARSANILHVLGSLTALCCVDKKGILSWPNPTAEKVFFLHNTDTSSQSSSLANLGELSTDADSLQGNEKGMTTAGEVLDLTHDLNDPFKLHFDNTNWHKHMNSLKPLGLAILLNTCNVDTQEHYTEFCSHITCEAMYNENLIPVTNRRCLCELATEIGFVDQVQKIFCLEQLLSTYRHLQNEIARRDNKFARSLQMPTKLKFPFPHMFAVVARELLTGSMQLLTQGTADLVMDACVDYWDGQDLCPLTNSDRKKIQDFYQRSSLTAYCTAFAYRPLQTGIADKLSETYLEIPSDSRHLYLNHRSPTPLGSECKSVLDPKTKNVLTSCYSTDSLLYDGPGSDISDIESCFEIQCNQVFIGMVTMQYQAQVDMVHLIEQLERACIRFVHFSKENELRSRVFSEKMGLESGWNCHISLLSERNRRESGPSECWANNGTARVCTPTDLPHRTRKMRSPSSDARAPGLSGYHNSNLDSSKALSHSAPSAINLEHAIVKFDTQNEMKAKHVYEYTHDESSHVGSGDSMNMMEMNTVTHEWQSLSCLTDSTEQSAPVNFDMSNRAKLPRGIDKIRPHIENIDNVPLLVSLFTDCTASSIKEMTKIMQDYAEVICVIGSSANFENIGIFMQADASIAIEPLYPQVCQKIDTFKKVEKGFVSPIDLARELNSVPCSLSINREDPINFYYLIMEARQYMNLFWNTVQFWLCSCTIISFMQVAAAALMLPALFTPGQVLWISCIVIPILSMSFMGNVTDPDIMKKAQGKKQIGFNTEVLVFVLWAYGIKFLPMVLSVIFSFSGSLASYCYDICQMQNCTCALFYLPTHLYNEEEDSEEADDLPLDGWTEHGYYLYAAQYFALILTVLHLITISVGFVHREHSIWKRSPHNNLIWIATVVVLLLLQVCYAFLNIAPVTTEFPSHMTFQISNAVIYLSFLSPLLTFVVNEAVKHAEIKVNMRYQRRARLDFGTKLGMNSPF